MFHVSTIRIAEIKSREAGKRSNAGDERIGKVENTSCFAYFIHFS